MTTIFIVEWTGCECGGACDVAFSTREKAQAWLDGPRDADEIPFADEYCEIKEVELR